MIEVLKLNNKKFFINCDLIETIEATPDTTITMTNGHKIIVRGTPEDIVEKVITFKKKILNTY